MVVSYLILNHFSIFASETQLVMYKDSLRSTLFLCLIFLSYSHVFAESVCLTQEKYSQELLIVTKLVIALPCKSVCKLKCCVLACEISPLFVTIYNT